MLGRSSFRWGIFAALAASGCDCGAGDAVQNVAPYLKVEPEAVDFGDVRVTDLRVRALKLTNAGKSVLKIKSSQLNTETGELTLGGEIPTQIQPGVTVELTLVYQPVNVGEDTGTLNIDAEDRDGVRIVSLRGRGVEGGLGVTHNAEACGATPDSLSFGAVVPAQSATKQLTLRADGTAPITILSVVLGQGTSTEFSVEAPPIGAVLEPGQTLELDATYAPLDGGPDSGEIVITHDGPGGGSKRISLCGQGVAPALCATPVPLDFGLVAVGTALKRTMTLESCGLEPVSLNAVALASDPAHLTDPGFRITITPALPVTLQAGQTVDVELEFTASIIAPASGYLRADSSALGRPETFFELRARGAQPCGLEAQPMLLTFTQGGATQKPVLISNNGASDCVVNRLQVTAGATTFSLLSPPVLPLTLGSGASESVLVQYTTAGAATTETGTLEVEGGSLLQIELRGEPPGQQVCTLDVNPAIINFGSVAPNTSRTMGVTLDNIGQDLCFLRSVALDSSSDPRFSAPNRSTGAITAGGSKSLGVVFLADATPGTALGELLVGVSDTLFGGTIQTITIPIFASSAPPAICVDPRRVDFGATTGVATMGFNIYACGGRDVTVNALDWTTPDSELGLQAAPALPFTLSAGQMRMITVSYQPQDAIGDTAILTVRSNDAVEPAIDVLITGGPNIVPTSAGRFLYFWQIPSPIGGDVVRIPLQGNTVPQPFFGPRTGEQCSGCHNVSPDGKFVAVLEFGLSVPSFQIIDTSNSVSLALPQEVRFATYFSWRPDVNATPPYQFVYDNGGDIFKASLFNGYEGPLTGASDAAWVELMPTWGSNGQIAFVRGMTAQAGQGGGGTWGIQGPSDLMLVPEAGGAAVPVTGASNNTFSNYYPRYSPNGMWIAYTQSQSAGGSIAAADARLFLVKSDQSGTVRNLPLANSVPGDGASSYPSWAVDGSHLSFSSSRSGGQGSWDIYLAPIDPTTGMDAAAFALPAANTSEFEHNAEWSP